jgi:hypothetical protein
VVGMTVASDRSETTTTAYLIPIEQILGTDPELLPCPYRGLEPFDEQHAEFFFGRDNDIAVLVEAVAAHPLVAVAGPSGVGKSSLVRAGLVPRLRAAGYRIVLLRPVPGQPVGPALSAELEGGDTAAEVVLVVDQFEELAATAPEAARELLERVGELVRAPAPIKAVLTLRSATLDEVMVPQLAGPCRQQAKTTCGAATPGSAGRSGVAAGHRRARGVGPGRGHTLGRHDQQPQRGR